MVLEISLNILSHQTENLGKFFVNGYAHERCYNAVQIRMIFLSMIVISANDNSFSWPAHHRTHILVPLLSDLLC